MVITCTILIMHSYNYADTNLGGDIGQATVVAQFFPLFILLVLVAFITLIIILSM